MIALMDAISEAVERAMAAIGDADRATPFRTTAGDPCGPGLPTHGSWSSLADPILRDRFDGLLVRAGMVGEALIENPSRLRERMEDALREAIIGVARQRPATRDRVDALVAELMTRIGERIVAGVEEWRPPTPED